MNIYIKHIAILMVLFACKPNNNSIDQVLEKDGLKLFIFLNTDCPLCNKLQGQFHSFEDSTHATYYVFPGKQPPESVKSWQAYNQILNQQIILDTNFTITNVLNAEITPQAVLCQNGKVVYSGLLTDQFMSIGAFKPQATINYIRKALNSLQNHEVIQHTKPVGCFIEPH